MSTPSALHTVAVIVQDNAEPFGLGSLVEVWGEPYHPEDDNPVFDFRVCTPRPGRVTTRSDFDLVVDRGLEAVADADLVCVSPHWDYDVHDDAVLEVLCAAHERGAIIYAHCSGSFTLGAAGLLDGRECTTHWRYTDRLQRAYPEALVHPDVLYCHDGTVLTGAGSAAGIDASLHLVRDRFGAHVASTTARRIVVPPHRDGGQAQFIARQVPECDAETLGPLLQWILEHLAEDLDVESLARRALMSSRTFARRFRAETGATPHAWVTQQRVLRAEQLLEQSDRSIEWIAAEVGFGNAATLRHHFTRQRGVSPQQYRRTFSGVA
ncbi:GlxA family transcriptional regulator [Nocardioides flavescens]|uniref:GlxA family transcriptional regulator n=1 Tax=Nocardioides flavescens TaxID=2691959 RepID=UPI001926D526|nr:helix-turn-helix domain-containing protein [Nocardioides flavescens]